MDIDLLFVRACVTNDLDECINILEQYASFNDIPFYKLGLRCAFYDNHIEVIKYLYYFSPNVFKNIINQQYINADVINTGELLSIARS